MDIEELVRNTFDETFPDYEGPRDIQALVQFWQAEVQTLRRELESRGKVGFCTRGQKHAGPCNGHPRPDCYVNY